MKESTSHIWFGAMITLTFIFLFVIKDIVPVNPIAYFLIGVLAGLYIVVTGIIQKLQAKAKARNFEKRIKELELILQLETPESLREFFDRSKHCSDPEIIETMNKYNHGLEQKSERLKKIYEQEMTTLLNKKPDNV